VWSFRRSRGVATSYHQLREGITTCLGVSKSIPRQMTYLTREKSLGIFFEISKYSSSKEKVDRIPIFPTMHFLVLGSTGLYTLYHSYLADQLTVLSFKVRSGISFVILLSRQGILSPFSSEIGTRYQPESPTTKGWQSSKEYWKTKIL
jgi:hypothetical protein